MFYLNFTTNTYPNGFWSLMGYVIEEVEQVPMSKITKKQYPIDIIMGSYFTSRELAETAAEYQMKSSQSQASLYDGMAHRGYAADREMKVLFKKFHDLPKKKVVWGQLNPNYTLTGKYELEPYGKPIDGGYVYLGIAYSWEEAKARYEEMVERDEDGRFQWKESNFFNG